MTDVTSLVTTPDGNVSLVASKTRKRFWKITGRGEPEEHSLQRAETFLAISPNEQFALTNKGSVFHFETMTRLFSVGPLLSMYFPNDSETVVTKNFGEIRILPLPDVSLEQINQKDAQLHNFRVCYQSLEVVPMVPFPEDVSPWADPKLCVRDQ